MMLCCQHFLVSVRMLVVMLLQYCSVEEIVAYKANSVYIILHHLIAILLDRFLTFSSATVPTLKLVNQVGQPLGSTTSEWILPPPSSPVHSFTSPFPKKGLTTWVPVL